MSMTPSSERAEWTPDQILAEIRRCKRKGEDLSFTAQRGTALLGAAYRAFGTYRAAVEAAGIEYESIWRRRFTKWNQPLIRKRLRELSRSGEAINSRRIRRTHPDLFGATIHWFGSYRAGIEAAGLDYSRVRRQDPHRWSRQAIVRELRHLRGQGKLLHHNAISQEMPELVTAAYRYFGTYRRAVEAAGIDYLKVRIRPQRTWNKRRIVSELKQLQREHKGLWARSVRLTHPYLPRVAKEQFGSYSAAARAAGIKPQAIKPPPYRKWSSERVADELKRLAGRDVKSLAPTRMRQTRSYLVRAAAKRFGSYRKAIESIGVDYSTVGRVLTRPMATYEVIARLQALRGRGKDLRYCAIERAEPRLLNAARRRFGSYEGAMKAAGIAYPPLPPLRHWTEKLVLNTLLNLHDKGEDLRYRAAKQHRLQLYEAARYYFGTYTNAVRVAEIRYDPMAARHRATDRRSKLSAYRAARLSAARGSGK
jgi:hypothetical protein